MTGPEGEPVKGSPYAADKRRGFRLWWQRRNRRRDGKPGDVSGGSGVEDEGNDNGDGQSGDGQPRQQRRFRPRGGGGRGRYGYFRPSRTRRDGPGGPGDMANVDSTTGEDLGRREGGGGNGGGGSRGRGAPRRFFRRNFRGGRGGGQNRGRSDEGGPQNGEGEGPQENMSQNKGPGRRGRPRYRRTPRKSENGGGEKVTE